MNKLLPEYTISGLAFVHDRTDSDHESLQTCWYLGPHGLQITLDRSYQQASATLYHESRVLAVGNWESTPLKAVRSLESKIKRFKPFFRGK